MLPVANFKDNPIKRDKPYTSGIFIAVNIDIVKHRLHKER